MDEEHTNWTKVAAWVFGVWSVMLPLSAAVIGYYQNRIAESTEGYRREIAQLRLDVLSANSAQNETISAILSRQMEVMRRVEVLERRHLPRNGE